MKRVKIISGMTLLAALLANGAMADGGMSSERSSQPGSSSGASTSGNSASSDLSGGTGNVDNSGSSVYATGQSGSSGSSAQGGNSAAQSGSPNQYGTSGNAAQTSGDAQSSGSGAAGQSSSGGQQAQTGHPVVYVLVPVETANTNPAMKTGCWARIYGDKNFTGDRLTLNGPFDLPNMVGPFGINWKDKVRSIEVGKVATVTVYDNENYRDQVTQFKPGVRIADVSKRMGFFDEFSSMKITCAK